MVDSSSGWPLGRPFFYVIRELWTYSGAESSRLLSQFLLIIKDCALIPVLEAHCGILVCHYGIRVLAIEQDA